MHASTLLLMTSSFFLKNLRSGHSLRLKIKHLPLRNSAKGTGVKAAPAGGLRWRKSVGRDVPQRRREKGFFGASRESIIWKGMEIEMFKRSSQ